MHDSWNSPDKFNREALQWDENPRRSALALAVSKAIIASASPNKTMRALEFGCGTGLVTMEIASLAGSIVAIDTSREMLAVFYEKIRTSGITNIETREIDLLSPLQNGLQQESFDLIYSSMTLHHISDTAGFLNRISNILAPGGMIAIADLDKEDGLFHDDPLEKVHHGFEREELAAMLEAAGLQKTMFQTAYQFEKENREGKRVVYPVFLVTAIKEKS
ncbi:MAG: class I SAM-dependent methyltransferase [Chlorobiaceae bacterium]|nr:class I SAM-dependent methyltransferase [Chlorobiaceae bacterium]NTV17556.1 class I SAM-dependent methyltransferase [Chlorobiaceae bacterium]